VREGEKVGENVEFVKNLREGEKVEFVNNWREG